MRRVLACLVISVILFTYLSIHKMVWDNRAQVRQEARADFVLPSRFNRILAFGNKGLLSDFQFLRLATFMGERILAGRKLADEDWRYFSTSIESITELDPYFLDPYFLAEGFLTWEAGQFETANRLLEKGVLYRDWDWRLPYFLGFNYFYFLSDYEKGAEYIMKAAKIKGAPAFLPSLASRLAYYGGKSKTAILFVKGMIAETSDLNLKNTLALRLTALERAYIIEGAVQSFKEDHGRFPTTSELVGKGYLEELPEDPYGGQWGILKNGRVFSTSKFVNSSPKKTEGESNSKPAE